MRSSLLLLCAACTEYELKTDPDGAGAALPEILVEPTRLDFWDVGGDEQELLTFSVHNVGEALLMVSELRPPASADFTVPEGLGAFELATGEHRDVDVVFTPTLAGPQEDTLVVVSNDPVEPEVPVELAGSGRIPWLVIDPETHDFGEVPLPCEDAQDFVLQNVGEEDLDVTAVTVAGDAQFALVEDPGAFTLGPGAYVTVTVAFGAQTAGDVAATLDVASNDPRGVRSASLSASPVAGEDVLDTFPVDDAPPVDVLFAVDQSGSMDDNASSLGDNFGAFVTAVEAATTGWQAGVVTYDDGCTNGGVLTASTPGFATTFRDAVTLGEDRDIADDEALFQIVDRALAQSGPGGCNEGFLRDGALLHVIVVSDEPERSPEQASAWTWDWWVGAFQGYLADPADLRISGVIDLDGCGEGADNYAEAIAATGGEAASICAGDWSATVASLASATTAGLWSYPLSAEPLADTLVVTVDGAATTAQWTWDATANAVVFATKPDGEQVEVTYAVAGTCE